MVRTDVVDVDSDGGVCADAVLLHEADQLALCQVVWWGCLALHRHVFIIDTVDCLGKP